MMIRIISALLLLLTSSAFAVEVGNLYEAKVLAKNNLTKEKKAAFLQVIYRVTGNPKAASNSEIDQALLEVTDYLVQFRYLDSGGKQYFWAKFDSNQIRKLLQKAKLPEWGRHRPKALFWIAREDSKGRKIISESSKLNVNSALEHQSIISGIPVALPLLDLNDTSLVSTSDIWGKFNQPIIEASSRYEADVIVVANMYPLSSRQWLLNWDLLGRKVGGQYSSLAHGEIRQSEYGVVKAMVEKVAQRLAKMYAVNLGAQSSDKISLRIHGLKGVESYVQINKLLSQVSAITQSQVAKMNMDQVTWNLTMLGGEQELMRALALDKRLRFISIEPLASSKPDDKNADDSEEETSVSLVSVDLINKYTVVHYEWMKQ